MKVHVECFPCFLRQAMIAARQISCDPRRIKEFIDLSLGPIRDASLDDTPAHIATEIYRKIRAKLNGADPFKEIKTQCTAMALESLDALSLAVQAAENPLEAAIRTSVAGNVIDFGIYSNIDLGPVVENIMNEQLLYQSFLR